MHVTAFSKEPCQIYFKVAPELKIPLKDHDYMVAQAEQRLKEEMKAQGYINELNTYLEKFKRRDRGINFIKENLSSRRIIPDT